MGRWLWRGSALALLVLALARAVLSTPEPKTIAPPDIVLITLDTTRTDHTSAYGYGRATTPRLEALAQQGAIFEAAYAPMATTLPAHATLFTAELPRSLGVTRNGTALAPGRETLAEKLREAGYTTAAFVSSFVLERRFGLGQGFEVYDDDFSDGSCPTAIRAWEGFEIDRGFCRRGAQTTRRAAAWLHDRILEEDSDEARLPFFLWVHYFDPHAPYLPAPRDAELFVAETEDWLDVKTAAYDGEIHYTDRQVGLLLDLLETSKRRGNTVVIVTADHGEGLQQHGHMHHSLLLYEEDVRVPMIVRWPRRIQAGKKIVAPVQLADLAPTLLDFAGVDAHLAGVGLTLAPALLEDAPLDPERPIFFQRREYEESVVSGHRIKGQKFGVRQGQWKYVEALEEGTAELYDLEADPNERRNLARSNSEQRRRMATILGRWREQSPRVESAAVDPEAEKRLRALGYVP